MTLLDTHSVIWWTLEPNKLSRTAARICSQFAESPAWLSSISIWEIAIKIKKGKLDLGISAREFSQRLNETGLVQIVPIDDSIWLRSVELEWTHTDPADRAIVATALTKKVPILTCDQTIQQFKGVQTIW